MALDWHRDGLDWPLRAHSRFVDAAGLRWHVQRTEAEPAAPTIVLIHGTGASTHSWRYLMPLLAARFTVVSMDLPGHGFTSTPPADRMSLPGMAASVGALLETLNTGCDYAIGHSAGAAIAARMVLDRQVAPRLIAGINGAFFPLEGVPGLLFPPVARLLAATPLVSRLFARRHWDRESVVRLVAGTGSVLDAAGIDLYRRLVADPDHAAGALAMMARWDLRPFVRDLGRLDLPVALVVGANDRAVAPDDARRFRDRLPDPSRCTIDRLADAGHLVHEERPQAVHDRLLAAWNAAPEDRSRLVNPDLSR